MNQLGTATTNHPELGFGLGLRVPHYAHIFEHWPAVDWFEIISENFMDTGGRPRRNLDRIRERYPVVMHGIALSIGTVDALNSEYLAKLKALADEVQPAWISDHLCWTGIAHKNSHDLLPVPYTEEALTHIVNRIDAVQNFLGRTIALENPSTYLEFKTSHIPEAEFIAQMAKRAGCNLLLDVNNVYVSSYNHRLDPKAYIDALPLERVIQIHLSGHSNMGTHIIDTHDDHVVDEVWALYQYTVHKAGRVPNTMVEWDGNIPEWSVLYAELDKAKAAARDAANYAPLPDLLVAQTPYTANRITALGDAQTVMQTAILNGSGFDSHPEDWIRAKVEFAPADQLAVYTNGYRYRLRDVTAEDFPVLTHYLGADRFNRLVEDFVNATHSIHFNVARYSAQLPQFVNEQLPDDGFAQALVVLENAVCQMADGAETEALTPAHLAGLTPETLMASRLYPRAALSLLAFDYPVDAYFTAVKEGAPIAAPAPHPEHLAVFRHEDTVWRMALEEKEFALLSKLFAGVNVGDAIAALQNERSLSETALMTDLSNWFARWMRNGLLAAEAS